MAKIVFDFSKLIIYCLHDKKIKFTNAVRQETNCKTFIAELFHNLQIACQEKLEELLEMHHFHLIKRKDIKHKIERLVDDAYLDLEKLCQIPLGKKPRLYGNLQKIKHTNLYLFQALILDPNHLIYEETNFAKLKNMTCLFSETDCSQTRELGAKKKKSD